MCAMDSLYMLTISVKAFVWARLGDTLLEEDEDENVFLVAVLAICKLM